MTTLMDRVKKVDCAKESAEPSLAKQTLARLDYPFDAGMATDEIIDKLELLNVELFDRYVSMPVPCSFLVDAEGSLAAIYRGPIDVQRLLRDVKNLAVQRDERRRLAVPFAGRWHTAPATLDLAKIARAYTRGGYHEDAIPLFLSALQRNPRDANSHNLLGVSLAGSGRPVEAERHYRAAIRLNPEFVFAQYNLGVLLADEGKTDQAIAQFLTVVRIAPSYLEARVRLALALQSQQNLPQATSHLLAAVRNNPDHFLSQYHLARVLAEQGKQNEAVVHFRNAVSIDPNSADALRRLALALEQSGDLREALDLYRRSLKLSPNSPDVHYNFAGALASHGQATDAIVHYRHALRLKRDWPSAANDLAWLLATHRDPQVRDAKEAVQLAERVARSLGDRVPQILDTLAAAYASAGQFDEAVQTAERAIRLATETNQKDVAEQIRRRLRLYKARTPYYEPSVLAPPK